LESISITSRKLLARVSGYMVGGFKTFTRVAVTGRPTPQARSHSRDTCIWRGTGVGLLRPDPMHVEKQTGRAVTLLTSF